MPVLAIGAAIVAGVEASAAIGAVIAGGLGALTVGGALSIVTAVGATLGAIGVVTGDKGLSTAGMILGGIGGIGSLAVGAGLFGEGAGASSVFGAEAGGADFASSVAVTPEIVGSNPGGFLGTAASGSTDALDVVDSFGGIKNPAVSVSQLGAPGSAASTSGDLTNSLLGGTSSTPASPAAGPAIADSSASAPLAPVSDNLGTSTPGAIPSPTAPGSAAPAAPSTPFAPAPGAADVPGAPVTVTPGNAATSNPGGYAGPSSPGLVDSFGNFLSNDKSGMLSYGLVQAGGSLISGLFDPLKPAQVKALNAQTAQTQANTGITQMQAANMAAPIPVARRNGLINSGANYG